MKALFYETFEGCRGIKTGEMPPPLIDDNEVLVKVKAFSLNHLDVWAMEGKLFPDRITLPHVFASDASGVVETTGRCVSHVSAGDEVIVYPGLSCGRCAHCLSGRDNECSRFMILGVLTDGVSAEYVKVPGTNIFRIPPGLSFEEAAGIGITYTTAWNSLVLRTGIAQGDTVLIHGGGSGVGTALIQIAKLYHATVITTVGDDWKGEKARELGADFVVNYRKEDFSHAIHDITGGNLVDIAVDHIGAETFSRTLQSVRRGGKVAFFGSTTGEEITLNLRYAFGKNITLHGIYMGPKASVPHYLRLFPRNLRTVIDSVHTFEDGRKAYEKLLSRQFFGKIMVKL
ncbi:MAG: zinc-binding dehydrogenase [Chloroflexota bacterium]